MPDGRCHKRRGQDAPIGPWPATGCVVCLVADPRPVCAKKRGQGPPLLRLVLAAGVGIFTTTTKCRSSRRDIDRRLAVRTPLASRGSGCWRAHEHARWWHALDQRRAPRAAPRAAQAPGRGRRLRCGANLFGAVHQCVYIVARRGRRRRARDRRLGVAVSSSMLAAAPL